MNLSLMGKIKIIIDFIFSSFLSIEMFLISLLLLIILIYNLKKNNRIVQLIAIGVYLGFVLGTFISYTAYVKDSFDSFIKAIMNYIYFPSTIIYFFIMIFVTIMMLYTIFSKNMKDLKKIVNISVFSILYFFFLSFLSLAAYNSYDLLDVPGLYENDVILSFVQLSNLLLLLWFIFTGFYHLYYYFKKKFDH